MKKFLLFISAFLIVLNLAAQSNRYWVNGSGNWQDTQHWSTTSGGQAGASIPDKNTNAIFDKQSNLMPGDKVSLKGNAFSKDLIIKTPSIALKGKYKLNIYGSIDIDKNTSLKKFKGDIVFNGEGKNSISTPTNFNSNLVFKNEKSQYSLNSNLRTKRDIKVIAGEFDTKGYDIESDNFIAESNAKKNINIENSRIITSSWNFGQAKNTNLKANNSNISVANVNTDFISGGLSYNLVSTKGAKAIGSIVATPTDALCPAGTDPVTGQPKEDGNINVVVNPAGYYYITIFDASVTEVARDEGNTIDFTLPPGSYTVAVSESNYNVSVTTVGGIVINAPPAFSVAISVEQDVLCAGGADLELRADETGGTGPIASFEWEETLFNPGSIFHTGQTTPDLGEGYYVVYATDANGCLSSDFFRYYPTAPGFDDYTTGPDSITVSGITTTPTCSNATSGEMTITSTSGGTPTGAYPTTGYGYYVTTNGAYNPVVGDFADGNIISGLAGGTYFLWIIDGNNCMVKHNSTIDIAVTPEPIVNAGADAAICANDIYTNLDATASEYSSLAWVNLTTGHTGFNDPNILNPTYTPNAADIIAGTVTLQLTALGNGSCAAALSTLDLSFQALPIPFAGASNDVCGNSYFTLDATQSNVLSTVQWSQISGPGTASFIPSNAQLITGISVDNYGTYVFQLEETFAGCSDTSHVQTTFVEGPTASVGNAQICEGSTHTLGDATASAYTTLTWINLTTGDGTGFDDPTALNPTYTPSAADITNGSVQLRLTATGSAPCPPFSSTMTLTITSIPTVFAGADISTCGLSYLISDAASDGATFNWSVITQPGGSVVTFNPDQFTLNTTADVSMHGIYIYELTATNGGLCSDVSTIEVTYVDNPTAFAGNDTAICLGEDLPLLTAASTNADTHAWTVAPGGSGTFDNAARLNPVFTPTNGTGTYTLQLVASQSAGTCPPDNDALVLTVNPIPAPIAGLDKEACGLSFNLEGARSIIGSTLNWTQIAGPGTSSFSPQGDPNATVTVSQFGIYTFQLEETAAACSDVATVSITFVDAPSANAGANGAICAGETYDVVGTGTNYDNVEWISSGDGGFAPAGTENATYTPGPLDITNGTVTLRFITKQASGTCPNDTSLMVLTINALPIPSITGDLNACENEIVTYSTDLGNSNYFWSVTGGSIVGPVNGQTVDVEWTSLVGTSISVNYENAAGCTAVAPTTTPVTVTPLPVVTFTAEITNACAGSTGNTYITQGGQFNYVWVVSPSGIVTNGGNTTDNFIEITWPTAGAQTVSVNYEDIAGCTAAAPTVSNVTVIDGPTAFAGNDTTICYDGSISLVTATAANNDLGVSWINTTTGDATGFDNANSLNPIYTPSAADQANGSVELVLSANSSTCGNFTDNIIVTLAPELIASVGAPSPYLISGTTEINVVIDGNHDAMNQLSFYLVAPDGFTEIRLYDHVTDGTPGVFPISQTFDSLVFSSASVTPLDLFAYRFNPTITGVFAAAESWAAFDGFDPAQGGWSVKIVDNVTGGTGVLTRARISFTDINTTTLLSQTIIYDSRTISEPILDPVAAIAVPTTFNVPIGLTTSCFGTCDARAVVSVIGGTGTYVDYLWSDGQTGPVVDLCGGDYTVTVIDSRGCSTIALVSVQEPDPIALAFDSTNVACFGDTTGMVKVIASLGATPYTYLWDDPKSSTTDSIGDLAAGTYTVTVTDAAGCPAIGSVNVTEPGSALEVSNVLITPANCNATDGIIDLTAIGGLPYVAGYEYELDFVPVPANPIGGLGVGTYTVSVLDSAGCRVDTTITMIDNGDMVITGFTEEVPVSCADGSNGEIRADFTGGNGNYSFDWSLISVGTVSTDSILLNATADSTYTVIVTDDLSTCSASANYTVANTDTLFLVKLDSTATSCFGGADGTAEVNGLRGTAPYSYYWINAANDTISTTSTVSGLSAGYIYISLKDALGCEVYDSVLITEPSAISATFDIQPAGCNSPFGSASVIPVGGTPFAGASPYDYLWTDANATTDSTVTNLPAGKFYVTVFDANGCSYYDSVDIVTATPITLVKDSTQTACPEDNSGTASVVASGGTGPYTYSWYEVSDPSTILSTTTSATGLAVGVYAIEVTDFIGCTVVEFVQVTDDGDVNFDIIIDRHVTCIDANNGIAKITNVTASSVPLVVIDTDYSVLWGNGETTDSVSNLILGNNLVTVTELGPGCKTTKVVTITDEDALKITDFDTFNDISSPADACNGSAKVNVGGGLDLGAGLSYDYAWSTGDNTDQITDLCAGWYYVTITDANNPGCTLYDSVEIIEDRLRFDTVQLTAVTCYGGNDGSIEVLAQGGWPGGYTYEWANENWSSYPAPDSSSASISNLQAGWYYLTLTDAYSNSLYDSIEVIQPTPFVAAYIIDSTRCDAPSGSISVNESGIVGGTAPFTYAWSHPDWTIDSTGLSISNLDVGYYYVSIDDAAGCTYTDSVQMVDSSLFVINLDADPTRCYGTALGSIESNPSLGAEPYTFAWSNGETTEDISGLSAGLYSLTVVDDGGCIRYEEIEVTQPDSIEFTIKDLSLNFCYNDMDANFKVVDITGGNSTDYVLELYSLGELIQTAADSVFVDLASNQYEIRVEDPLGCFSTDSIDVYSEFQQIIILNEEVTIDPASCNKFTNDGKITIDGVYVGYFNDTSSTITPPTAWQGFDFNWIDYPGENEKDIDGVYAGVAALEIDMNGSFCPDTFYFDVPSSNTIEINDIYFFDNNMSSIYACKGDILDATVEVTGATVSWTSTSTILTDTNVPFIQIQADSVDVFNLTATNEAGCIDTASITAYAYLPQNMLDARITDDENVIFEGNIIELAANEIEVLYHHEDEYSITVENNYYWKDTIPSENSEWITSIDTITPSVRPRRTTLYRVTDSIRITNPVYGVKTCVLTDTIGVTVMPEFNPPSGFTPNEDSYNDVWRLPGVGGYDNVVVQIYNRWGGLVWTFSGNYEGNEWDGNNQSGKALPSGTYYYVIKYGDDAGDKTLTGPITILR